jgi:cell shape-determining protein MreC
LGKVNFVASNKVFQVIASPIWKTQQAAVNSLSSFFAYFDSKADLEAENEKLRERAELLRLEVLNTRAIEKENAELKKSLGREDTRKDVLISQVLLKPFATPFDTFVIDIGENLKVAIEDKVFVAGIPVGKIAEVYPESSLVRLYSSPGQEYQVYLGADNIEALAKSHGANNFFVVLPKETKVAEGDIVSIPSIHTNTFAIVNEIETSGNESFQYIYFRGPVNINEVKWVEVEKNNE